MESRRVHDLLCVGRIGIIPHCRGVAVPVGEAVGRIEVLVSVGEWLSRQGERLVEEQQRGRNERQRTDTTQNDEPNRMMLPGRRQLPKWQRKPARLRPNLRRSHYCVFETQDPDSTERRVPRPGFGPTLAHRSRCCAPSAELPLLRSSPRRFLWVQGARIPPPLVGRVRKWCTIDSRAAVGHFRSRELMCSVPGRPQDDSRRSVVGRASPAGRDCPQVEGVGQRVLQIRTIGTRDVVAVEVHVVVANHRRAGG